MPLAEHERAYQRSMVEGWVGLVTDQPALRIPQVGLAVADNCTIRDGVVERIPGYQQLGSAAAGICYGLWQFKKHQADGTVARSELVLFGTALTDYTTPGSPSSIGSITGSVYCTAAQAGNRMFFSNGSDTPKVWDGASLQEVNCPVPTTPTHDTFVDSGGYLEDAGAYELRTTYYDPVNGDESNPSAVLTETVAGVTGGSTNNTWSFDQPATAGVPSRFTVLRLYRTEKNLKEHRYEKEFTSFDPSIGDTGLIAGDTYADGDLAANALVETDHDDMPKYQIIFFWDNKLWGVGNPANPTHLGRSKDLNYTAWDVLAPMELGQKDGLPLRGLALHPVAKGRLYAFKRSKAFQIGRNLASGVDDADGYSSSEIPGGIGVLDHWAMTPKNGALWGIGDGLLWRFDGSRFDSVSQSAFDSEMARWKSADNVTPLFLLADNSEDRDELLICARDASGSKSYLYNTRTGGLTRWVPGATDIASWFPAIWERDDGRDWVVAGSRDGKVYELWEETTRGTPIVAYVTPALQKFRTGALDPDATVEHKMARWLDIYLAAPTTLQPDESDAYELYVWYDDTVTTPTPYEFGPYGSVTKNIKVFTVGLDGRHFRYLSVEIRAKTNDKAFRLMGLRLGWKPVGFLTAL